MENNVMTQLFVGDTIEHKGELFEVKCFILHLGLLVIEGINKETRKLTIIRPVFGTVKVSVV